MKTIQFRALCFGTVLALSGNAARGAFETQDLSYGSTTPVYGGSTVNLSYNRFDPSLGQLIGVAITFNTWDAAQPVVYSPLGAGYSYAGASVTDGSETVSALGYSLATSSLGAGPFSGKTSELLNLLDSGTVVANTQTFQATDFSSFIGVGPQILELSVIPGAAMFSGNGMGSTVFFGGTFYSYGDIEIDYSYLPNVIAIPEASPFPFFTAGMAALAGLGGLVYRVRRPAV